MARGVKGKITVVVDLEEYDDGGAGAGSATKRLPHWVEYTWEVTGGTTDGTMLDRIYSSAPSLTTTPTDLDLVSASSLASAMDSGLNVGMSDLAVICVLNTAAAGSGDVDVGASSAPVTGWTLANGDGVSVGPQGILLWVAPYGVATTATTADLLRVVASTGTVTSKVLVAGRST